MFEYDVVVIGSGTAGQTAAHEVNQDGLKVALVEKSEYPGGTCALSGCQPKKWFYEVTELTARSKHLSGKGVIAPPEVKWSSILEQKNRFTYPIPDGTVEGLMEVGIDFFEGAAKFTGSDSLRVENDVLKANYIILAVGASPMRLPINGAEHVITSTDFLGLENLPPRIFFIGGGFISFEFAHFAARLGPKNSEIVIGEAVDRPLGNFDSEMVGLLVSASEDEGIQVRTSLQIKDVEKKGLGYVVSTDSGERFETDLVVHGAGRVASLDGLDLEVGGVSFSKRGIEVDERMRTSNPRVYAVGDCAATTQLARVGDYEGWVAARNILSDIRGGGAEAIDYETVPAILFTYPQYGMVGKTEDLLIEEGIDYKKSFSKHLGWPTYRRIGMKHAAYKILTGPDNEILGAHFLSDNPSGLINTIKMAMMNKTPADLLYRQCIMTPYPSRESDIIYMLKTFL